MGTRLAARSEMASGRTNTPNQLPRRDRRKAKPGPKTTAKVTAKATVGLDFGSASWRAAVTPRNGRPEIIPLGRVNNSHDGTLILAYKYPTYTRFGGDGRFSIMGHKDVTEFKNISSGAKQALDDELCELGGEGQNFRDLCKANNTNPLEVITAQLKILFELITLELKKRVISQSNDWRVNIAVPVIWTRNQRGQDIQNQIKACAIEAGFPDDIGFDVEPFLTDAYVRRHEHPKSQQRRGGIKTEGVHIDAGAATTVC